MLRFPVVTGRLAPCRFKFNSKVGGIESAAAEFREWVVRKWDGLGGVGEFLEADPAAGEQL
jgi:hypothetical protein